MNLHDLAKQLREEKKVSEFLALLSDEAPIHFEHTEKICENLFVRPMRLGKAGAMVVGHQHTYAHVTVLFSGSVNIKTCDTVKSEVGALVCVPGTEKERQYKAPAEILIPAMRYHEITALEDNTIAKCFFSHRDYKGKVVDTYLGNYEATT